MPVQALVTMRRSATADWKSADGRCCPSVPDQWRRTGRPPRRERHPRGRGRDMGHLGALGADADVPQARSVAWRRRLWLAGPAAEEFTSSLTAVSRASSSTSPIGDRGCRQVALQGALALVATAGAESSRGPPHDTRGKRKSVLYSGTRTLFEGDSFSCPYSRRLSSSICRLNSSICCRFSSSWRPKPGAAKPGGIAGAGGGSKPVGSGMCGGCGS